nr:retrovirus-related Pol polyprotein from transposon TNT 1-94 [Tanacetum cinerariifolium]
KTDAIVIHDSEETLMLGDESRYKMLQKQNDPIMSEKKTELSAEQAFWSRYSVQSEEPNLSSSTTIVEVPKELSKVSMVNSSLKKLKFHLASFDVLVKERTTATTIMEGTWGFRHTKACFRDEIIPFVKALKELFNSFYQFLIDELIEVQNVFSQMEQAEKVLVITALKETLSQLKGKAVVNEAVTLHPIDPELLKIDVASLALKLRNNRTAHTDYLRHTQKETATLREIVKSERFLNPLNTSLDYACKIQRTPSKAEKNNLEDHPRTVIHSLNKKKSVVDTKAISSVTNSKLNINDHLCSACAMGKIKKKPRKPKSKDTNQEKLYLLHMDLCGPMRVESVNGKKYILVIVDDYSRFTWVKFLRSKDEAPDFIIKFLKMIQVRLKVLVRRIQTDNGTEFVNQTLCEYYEEVGISHETSVAHSPQQNGVVERRNRTLIEAARTMLIYAQALLFLWAEAVATACYTQNRSTIRLRHRKTPYELLHNKLPDLSFLHVFGALCYPTNDSENLKKLQPKADIGIFIGYVPTKKAFRIYNRCTRQIVETIHVDFEELTAMASEQSSSGPALNEMTHATISSGLMQKPSSSTPYVPPSRNDWDLLFQPMFDELLNPPPSVDHQAPEVIASIVDLIPPVQANSTGSPSSTSVDQDAPS